MKALCTDKGIAELQVRDVALPTPGPGEVRVRVAASALNPADQKVLGGEFAGNMLHGKKRPLVAGYDFAGAVDAVGSGADLKIGDEVFGFMAYGRVTQVGAFAEHVVIAASCVALRPESLSAAAGAALATAAITSLQAMRDVARVQPGQRVLVVGGSGGVGSLAIGVAVKLGAHVTAICGAGAVDLVRSLGASEVLVRGQDNVLIARAPYDMVFDTAAAYTFFSVRHMLAPGGAYVTTLPGFGLFVALALAPLLGKRAGFVVATSKRADLEQLARWSADGLLIPIDSTFAVRDVAKSLARLAKGSMKGRVVINVADGFAP